MPRSEKQTAFAAVLSFLIFHASWSWTLLKYKKGGASRKDILIREPVVEQFETYASSWMEGGGGGEGEGFLVNTPMDTHTHLSSIQCGLLF